MKRSIKMIFFAAYLILFNNYLRCMPKKSPENQHQQITINRDKFSKAFMTFKPEKIKKTLDANIGDINEDFRFPLFHKRSVLKIEAKEVEQPYVIHKAHAMGLYLDILYEHLLSKEDYTNNANNKVYKNAPSVLEILLEHNLSQYDSFDKGTEKDLTPLAAIQNIQNKLDINDKGHELCYAIQNILLKYLYT